MRTILVILTFLLAGVFSASAQTLPQFNMTDTVVDLCKGILLDSEAGNGGATYGNNEDFEFTICTGGTIIMTFSPTFCTEAGLDLLTFHDGPTAASPQIGPAYSGTTPPPAITANSGCLTVHFVSDISVAYCGWEAQWTAIVPPPIPPAITVNPIPTCNTSTLDLTFDRNVPCDSIYPNAFAVSGLNIPNVISAVPTSCSGDSTLSAQLTLDIPFDQNCNYDVQFDISIPDRCDSIYNFTVLETFLMNNCPLTANLQATEDTVCAGGCVDIEAIVDGCLGYTFAWTPALPATAGPHAVCPITTTTYSCLITENATGNQITVTQLIEVVDPQILLPDTTVCQSIPPLTLTAFPNGGMFYGPGIIDSAGGIWEGDTAGPGVHTIYYQIGSLCRDSVIITVDSMDAGPEEAACPGSPPFAVSGFSPIGGTWSGSHIAANGIFTPDTSGTFVVTYSAGGCTDTKIIFVDSISFAGAPDTVCQQADTFSISILPAGGEWTGPGIMDSITGLFDPDEAGGGDHVLTYSINGCSYQHNIYVHPIFAGWNTNSCPFETPYIINGSFSPAGGIWSGPGITDPNTGLFDPFFANAGANTDAELVYTAPNGCTDTIINYVRVTNIGPDTVFFCQSDDSLRLNWDNIQRTPWGGVWTGAGIVNQGSGDWDFYPTIAGPGEHLIIYEANTCVDSVLMIVYPDLITFPDSLMCSSQAAFQIANLPAGTIWSGSGISSPTQGIYDPSIAASGTNTVTYTTPAGCTDTVEITVYPFVQASIGNLDPIQCFKDTIIFLNLQPADGVLVGGTTDSTYNPAIMGEGVDTLIYTYGIGDCFTVDTFIVSVLPELTTTVNVSQDTVCQGGGAVIGVTATGGDPSVLYSYSWNEGLIGVPSHSVAPTTTTTYVVVTSDGCSDPAIDSITIAVFDPFTPDFETSPEACFGEMGWIAGNVTAPGNYSFAWDTNPITIADSIFGTAGTIYNVTVTEDSSGCYVDTLIKIPNYSIISASFSANPLLDCVPYESNDVTFIDLSNNALSGTWYVNGESLPYVSGSNLNYEFVNPGIYDITLIVENEGGCPDTAATTVCIKEPNPIFVPDAFSPNGDGMNDVFYVRGNDITDMELLIFDRWGEKVFESTDPNNGWDGTRFNQQMPEGVYVYILRVGLEDEGDRTQQGDFTLVR